MNVFELLTDIISFELNNVGMLASGISGTITSAQSFLMRIYLAKDPTYLTTVLIAEKCGIH